MNWFEYPVKQRYKEVYNKYTIKDFYDFWKNDEEDVMELRFSNMEIAKQAAKKHFVKRNLTNVYTNNPLIIKNIIRDFRKKDNIWFGVNPKRKIINRFGGYNYTGKDVGIKNINHLFIDIDRKTKQGIATKKDLFDADFVANKLLEELGKEGFNNNYCKICSGNGLQLLIKLDIPFMIPMPEYDALNNSYKQDSLYLNQKDIIRLGIGKILPNFSKKLGEHINAEIDDKCFNMGRVAAMPHTFNFKHGKIVPRGLIHISNDKKNRGLSDYLKEIFEKRKTDKNFNAVTTDIKPVQITKDYNIEKNNIEKNVLLNLLRTHKFPSGGINNTLWFSAKILLHANNVSNTDAEYLKIHEELKRIHNRGFSDNGLEEVYKGKYNGDIKKDSINSVPFIVNKYLRTNKALRIQDGKEYYHAPLFDVHPKGMTSYDLFVKDLKSLKPKKNDKDIELTDDYIDFYNDLKILNKKLRSIRHCEGSYSKYLDSSGQIVSYAYAIINKELLENVQEFLWFFKKKWGDEIYHYMKQNYLEFFVNYKKI